MLLVLGIKEEGRERTFFTEESFDLSYAELKWKDELS